MLKATLSDWLLRKQYEADPDCITMDLHGNPALPWQQERCKEYLRLVESRSWLPEVIHDAGRVGLWNQFENKLMVPAKFEEFLDIPELCTYGGNDCLEIITRRGTKWGSVCSDGKGTVLCPFLFDRVSHFEYGYLLVEKDGLYSLWSREEGFVIPIKAKRIWFDEEKSEILYTLN